MGGDSREHHTHHQQHHPPQPPAQAPAQSDCGRSGAHPRFTSLKKSVIGVFPSLKDCHTAVSAIRSTCGRFRVGSGGDGRHAGARALCLCHNSHAWRFRATDRATVAGWGSARRPCGRAAQRCHHMAVAFVWACVWSWAVGPACPWASGMLPPLLYVNLVFRTARHHTHIRAVPTSTVPRSLLLRLLLYRL